MTISEAYNDFLIKLKPIYEDRESENISDWVFENVTGLKKWERRENKNVELKKSLEKKIEKSLDELLEHKPVQYILNEAWFYKMKFFVNENVLIPRPETEELVEWLVSDLKNGNDNKQTNMIDIGTGSGCIPIALKKELPNSNITSIDISEEALLVAKKNAQNLEAEINFLQVDFLNENSWKRLDIYDLMISNPPYIPINEKEILSKNVTEFEPAIALFVENNDPFIFYKQIVEFSKNHLKEKGKIYVEVHEAFAQIVKKLFQNVGYSAEIKKDIYGKERMIRAEKVEKDSKIV